MDEGELKRNPDKGLFDGPFSSCRDFKEARAPFPASSIEITRLAANCCRGECAFLEIPALGCAAERAAKNAQPRGPMGRSNHRRETVPTLSLRPPTRKFAGTLWLGRDRSLAQGATSSRNRLARCQERRPREVLPDIGQRCTNPFRNPQTLTTISPTLPWATLVSLHRIESQVPVPIAQIRRRADYPHRRLPAFSGEQKPLMANPTHQRFLQNPRKKTGKIGGSSSTAQKPTLREETICKILTTCGKRPSMALDEPAQRARHRTQSSPRAWRHDAHNATHQGMCRAPHAP